jgi:tRNA dimethylallyltransferase
MKKICVIVGPTGSGKTKLSIDIAKKFQGEIINGDSVQVYKGYDIGSAKIKDDEMQHIKHHLLSHVSPEENYDVSRFQKDGRSVIENIDFPIVCGGTGLYIKALLYDYEFKPLKKHEDITLTEKIDYILKHDSNIDIDFKNERRVDSAYQLILNGYKKSEINRKNTPLYDILTIYLDVDRAQLKQQLMERLDQQLSNGFISEVKTLKEISPIKNVIGYKEIEHYLNNEIDFETMKDMIILKSMKFAKKQKTWFKNQMKVIMFQAYDKDLTTKVEEAIRAWR